MHGLSSRFLTQKGGNSPYPIIVEILHRSGEVQGQRGSGEQNYILVAKNSSITDSSCNQAGVDGPKGCRTTMLYEKTIGMYSDPILCSVPNGQDGISSKPGRYTATPNELAGIFSLY
mmetsp:Transcript_10088/g.22114  ORF Transcript_10088/g.22114 Transcript_10088/m.22114 type:complete len:117 (-) Transcript_10088:2403-2753(-)